MEKEKKFTHGELKWRIEVVVINLDTLKLTLAIDGSEILLKMMT